MTGMALSSFLGRGDIEALERPTGEAIGLPGRAYGAAFYALEQRSLFPRLWCAIGFASDIPEPGDAMPADLAGWPLALVRGRDGQVRAFHNICRHRAMRVLQEPCRRASALVCPWHAWTYDLDGRLVGTPRIGGERAGTDPAVDTAGLDLRPVRVGVWQDLVFVNIDGAAPPFEQHIAPLDDLVRDYDLSDLRLGGCWETEYPGNWKVAVEDAIEDYHIPWGHPQLNTGVVAVNARLHSAARCFYALSNAREFRSAAAAAPVAALDTGLPPVLRAGPGVEQRTFFMSLFPTGILQTRVEDIRLGLFAPVGPDRTRVVIRHYYKGDAATDPHLAAARESNQAEWKYLYEQDIPFVRNAQETYAIRDAAGIETRFAPFWEANVHAFQRDVAAVLGEAEAEAAAQSSSTA